MVNFQQFCDIYLDYIIYFVALVLFFIQFYKTSSVKKAVNSLKELCSMVGKYKTAYDKNAPFAQKFSSTIPDYILNTDTNELERSPVDKNIQEYIQSFADVAIQRAIEKFLPKQVVESDEVTDFVNQREDLSYIGEAMDRAEYYRDKYNLPDNYTINDIYKFVSSEADKLKNKLYSKPLVKDDKGVVDNGKDKA